MDSQNPNSVFQSQITTPVSENTIPTDNQSVKNDWNKIIPSTNIGFLVVSLVLVLGLDLLILVNSPDLFPFFAEMLIVLGVFGIFFYLENFVFKKRFLNTQSKLDGWITTLVILRNIAFVLNFIPLIQILGGVALFYGGVPYLIIYSILLAKRFKVTHV